MTRKERRQLLGALGNLADNQADLQKEGEKDADPAPYMEVAAMVAADALDESKLTPAQVDALTIAREEVAEGNLA